jgi:deazaflavin-dependent oxidoreductase (nitroreductase family)
MKRRIVRGLQKYVLNQPIRLLFAAGIAPPGYALLETIGRKTGKSRRTPVGDGRVGNQFWLVAEHGREASYVRNIAANPRVRVKLRDGLRMRWYQGTAHLLPNEDPRERQRWLGKQRPSTWMNAMAVRGFGTKLLTVRIDLDRREL